MDLPPPPETNDVKELKAWCHQLWQFLQFPVFETIKLSPRAVPTSSDQTAEGVVYQDSTSHTLKARNASAFTDCNS